MLHLTNQIRRPSNKIFLQVVHVSWNDAPIAEFIHKYRGRICRMNVEYTLEIIPHSEAPIKSRVFEEEPKYVHTKGI